MQKTKIPINPFNPEVYTELIYHGYSAISIVSIFSFINNVSIPPHQTIEAIATGIFQYFPRYRNIQQAAKSGDCVFEFLKVAIICQKLKISDYREVLESRSPDMGPVSYVNGVTDSSDYALTIRLSDYDDNEEDAEGGLKIFDPTKDFIFAISNDFILTE